MTPRMIKVVWLDSGLHIDHGWAPKEEYTQTAKRDRMYVVTVGMLMDEQPDSVLVGLNYDSAHETWIGAQLIARENIVSMEELHT